MNPYQPELAKYHWQIVQNWCKVSQQKLVVVRRQSGNHRKRFTPELVQSFTAKASSRTQSVRQSP